MKTSDTISTSPVSTWQDGFSEGYKIGRHEKIVREISYMVIAFFLGLVLGYWLCYQIYLSDLTKCEKDSMNLEQEFHQAIERPRSFHIFNSQFKVWPNNFIVGLIVKQYSSEILAEAQRREAEEKRKEVRKNG